MFRRGSHRFTRLALAAAITIGTTSAESQIRRESDLQQRLAKEAFTFYIAVGDEDACGSGCRTWIAVGGQFGKGAADRFIAFVKRAEAEKLPVFFNSTGGLTDEGIAIGRFLNRSGMRVGIAATHPECTDQNFSDCKSAMAAGRPTPARWSAENAVCSSACVFAFMGANTRWVPADARVGIHATAYFCFREDGRVIKSSGRSKDAVECRRKLAARAAQLSKYFSEMGVSFELVQLMDSIPSSKIRFLSRDELKQYRIERNDHRFSK